MTNFVNGDIMHDRNRTKVLFYSNIFLASPLQVRNILAFMGVDSKSVVLLSIEYVSNYVNNEVSSEGRWKMKKTNLIKTPKERITLGECVRTETGEPALKVKKSNKDMYETISMSQLIELMVLMSNQN